jgi:hypothetical protein
LATASGSRKGVGLEPGQPESLHQDPQREGRARRASSLLPEDLKLLDELTVVLCLTMCRTHFKSGHRENGRAIHTDGLSEAEAESRGC